MNDYEGLPPDQDDYTPEQLVEEPEPKRARVIKENWIEALGAEAPMEIQFSQIMDALEETDEALMMSVELDLSSNRQRKFFARNPVAFLVKKLNNAEVQIKNLSADDRLLFDRAKTKEVSSFIKNSAVQRCLDNKEVQKVLQMSSKKHYTIATTIPSRLSTRMARRRLRLALCFWAFSIPTYWIGSLKQQHQFNPTLAATCSISFQLNINGHWKVWIWLQHFFRRIHSRCSRTSASTWRG